MNKKEKKQQLEAFIDALSKCRSEDEVEAVFNEREHWERVVVQTTVDGEDLFAVTNSNDFSPVVKMLARLAMSEGIKLQKPDGNEEINPLFQNMFERASMAFVDESAVFLSTLCFVPISFYRDTETKWPQFFIPSRRRSLFHFIYNRHSDQRFLLRMDTETGHYDLKTTFYVTRWPNPDGSVTSVAANMVEDFKHVRDLKNRVIREIRRNDEMVIQKRPVREQKKTNPTTSALFSAVQANGSAAACDQNTAIQEEKEEKFPVDSNVIMIQGRRVNVVRVSQDYEVVKNDPSQLKMLQEMLDHQRKEMLKRVAEQHAIPRAAFEDNNKVHGQGLAVISKNVNHSSAMWTEIFRQCLQAAMNHTHRQDIERQVRASLIADQKIKIAELELAALEAANPRDVAKELIDTVDEDEIIRRIVPSDEEILDKIIVTDEEFNRIVDMSMFRVVLVREIHGEIATIHDLVNTGLLDVEQARLVAGRMLGLSDIMDEGSGVPGLSRGDRKRERTQEEEEERKKDFNPQASWDEEAGEVREAGPSSKKRQKPLPSSSSSSTSSSVYPPYQAK